MEYLFNDSKYTKWYYQLIIKTSNLTRNKKENYYEKHHIIPKSLGGNNFTGNIVLLTPKEHFICHLLLPKMCIDKVHIGKMVYAFFRMKENVKNSNNYDFFKRKYSKLVSGKGNSFYGMTHSEEAKKIIGKKSKDRYHSEEAKRKMSKNTEKKFGKDNPVYGIPRTDQQKQQQSDQIKGRIGIMYNGTVKRVKPAKLQTYINNGWILKKRDRHIKQYKVLLTNGGYLVYNTLPKMCKDLKINYTTLRNRYYKNKLPYKNIISITREGKSNVCNG